jgi:hypothetical protein
MQGKYNIKYSGRSSTYYQSKIRALSLSGNDDQMIADMIGCHKTRVAQIRRIRIDIGILVRESPFKRWKLETLH